MQALFTTIFDYFQSDGAKLAQIFCTVWRYIAPLLGSALSFGTHEFLPNGHAYQIPLFALKALYDCMYSHAGVGESPDA